jgi:DNA-binding transcriptional ArsR family regulator
VNIHLFELTVKSANGFGKQALLFRALAHPVRLRIMDLLAHQEACVCHLTTVLGKRQPYVSQQLAMLRDAGLVTDRRDGTLIYYRLADGSLAVLLKEGRVATEALAGEGLVYPPSPDGPVANCPCPRCQEV